MKFTGMQKFATTVALGISLLIAFQSPAAAQDSEISIGVLISATGPAAPFGIPERDAVDAIVKQLNADGGIKGKKIRVSVYDDATNPTESARGITQLIQKDKVVAIVGSTTGSGTLAAAPVAARNKVPVLAINGTVSVISKENAFFPWVFRALPGDLTNSDVLMQRAIAGGVKKIAIFYQEDAYGKNTADYLQELATKYKIEVTGVSAAAMNATDLTPQATKLRQGNPESVLMQVSAPSVGAAFVRAAKQVGLTGQLWAPIGLGQKSFIDASGPAGDGVRLVVLANWDDPTEELKPLGQLLRKYGKTPSGFGELIAANGILAIVEAIKKVDGQITGEAIREKLDTLCGVKFYTAGKVCYSPTNHDGWGADFLTTVEIRGGKFITLR
jgi:branched-chain amino acid transport system substrate-binding protein